MIRALALLAALLLGAAAQAQTLTIALREDPDILDPTLGSAYVSRVVYAAMCDKLIDLDAGLNLVPQLATSWAWEDPLHLVLHLRPGVVFHDGEPFNAEAVRYKLTRDLTLKGSMRAGEVNAISGIEVVDPLTVRLVLRAPNAPLLAQLADRAGIMISPKAAEAMGAAFGTHPVCAGPYQFESRVAQDSIILRRFPAYWDAASYHFDRVFTARCPAPPCAWPTCAPAPSISWSTCCRATWTPCGPTRACRSPSGTGWPTPASTSTSPTARPPTPRWAGTTGCARRSRRRWTAA